ncbi:MAG: DEAD/DEAH box helicase family protein [Gomphosphaeria aponina SAG 52.96 = DSM 107014]|uniref:DEAD/DEAH box helicase family protein n=1 Tax=Gomphosphaeria aponina SAG 52.96 = DSM 107014 TaxID=1521640 RepID=A0A941JMI3_9CHRO|nr:DEAD/DEAH box helicase family protein [Gomphosphaeria aponina SAG 52.96 = DSM 107014]
MPRIFDNIEQPLLPILQQTLQTAKNADFCVGYFNLRGWQKIDNNLEHFLGGKGACCRLLLGMQKLPETDLHRSLSLRNNHDRLDNRTVIRFKKQATQAFCDQLIWGAPTNEDEAALLRLRQQIKAQKVVVKLFLKHQLHAKLYLVHRHDINNPTIGFLGSSNLTLSGLQNQGELNVDILDHDACEKLQKWFDDRWDDRWCVDISQEIVKVLDESWAREELIPPYYIYLKIAYHLSSEARAGLSEYEIPRSFSGQLFEFQTAAVKIAARHLNKRGGVLIGDVVGLGKTRIAATLAKILEEDFFLETLIICPKNLVKMWEDYVYKYQLHAKVLSMGKVQTQLPNARRYRVVIIDESHNLRNRQGKRYRAIQEYIALNESRCILLTATPYNKTYLDLSNQLRLFIPEDQDLGSRPEKLLEELGGEIEFMRKHQAPVRSLAAFEGSEHPDDWRELMRLYLVRRTRSFIQNNYAKTDESGRRYLEFPDGTKSYFPIRQPQTLTFDPTKNNDPYGVLYSEAVVNILSSLNLPRYGLGNYAVSESKSMNPTELIQIKDLSRAGKRLMGFCRTNLFKRLESSGVAFFLSLQRHILRNFVFLHAIAHQLPLPIGTQDAAWLTEGDRDSISADWEEDESETDTFTLQTAADYQSVAVKIYEKYATRYKNLFKWISPSLFKPSLKKHLQQDCNTIIKLLKDCGNSEVNNDQKLEVLINLLSQTHPQEKVLIFTQFADTVHYLTKEIHKRGIEGVAGVTGNSKDPANAAWRFSPESNEKTELRENQLRILIGTDVLSEGLNLQDCAIIVNYDLPWAIIRLIQRAGRIDRIGQTAAKILCYSFLPVAGVEKIIKLRSRLRQRLKENAEVVGTDEAFFEDDINEQIMLDLYHEKSGIFDGEDDTEVDLTSEAYQIWKNATDADPSLKKAIENLANVVYSTRDHQPTPSHPEGVLLYLKTPEGNDSLAWIDQTGKSVTQSQLAILRAAACHPDTPPIPRNPKHHDLVKQGTEVIAQDEKNTGGQLGRLSGARFRTYERLKRYSAENAGTLFVTENLKKAINQLYQYPLRQSAIDSLNRVLKSGGSDQQLAELIVTLYLDDRLCIIHEEAMTQEPQIICSLGLFRP